jgi:hypothetical protein
MKIETIISILVVTPLLGSLWLMNLLRELREVRKKKFPNPGFLLFQRSALAALVPWSSTPVGAIKGRRAWISWDIRWLAAGETMARVIDVDTSTNELTVALEEEFNGGGLKLGTMRFQPRLKWTPYGKREVEGRLLPAIDKDLYATAGIVIYPEGV